MSTKRKDNESETKCSYKKQKYNDFLQLLLDTLSCLPQEVIITIIYEYTIRYKGESFYKLILTENLQGNLYVPEAIAVTENKIYIASNSQQEIYVIDKNSDDNKIIKVINIKNVKISNMFVNKNDLFLVSNAGITILNKKTGNVIKKVNRWENNTNPFFELVTTDYNDKIYVLIDETNKNNKVYIFDKNTHEFTGEFNFTLNNRVFGNHLYIAIDDTSFYVTDGSNIHFSNNGSDHFWTHFLPTIIPRGISLSENEVFVVDCRHNFIRVYNRDIHCYVRGFGYWSSINPSKILIDNDKIFLMGNNRRSIQVWKRLRM
jgi:hypothetical protein